MSHISSHQILAATGIQSATTLTRWHNQGLIPKPIIDSHPTGKGRIAYWPTWVLERCKRIRDLTDQRLTLDEIKEKIGTDFKKEEAQSVGRYRMRDVSQQLDYSAAVRNFAVLVSGPILPYLAPLAPDRRKLVRLIDDFLFSEETVDNVLDGLTKGHNPTILFDGVDLEIVPDFIAAQLLADSASSGQVFVMKSIHQEASISFAKLLKDAPSLPTIKPSCCLDISDDEECKRVDFTRVGSLDFELDSTKQIGDAERQSAE